AATPKAIRLPQGVEVAWPFRAPKPSSKVSQSRARGGESEGAKRAAAWLRKHLDGYGSRGHDALADDATSRLSPYLHFGCISWRCRAVRARERGGDAFTRQLCWRDFYAQLLHARPETQVEDFRPRGDRWVDDGDALAAWREGITGFPLVDAGMRQLREE